MALKSKSSGAVNSDMPKRSRNVLSLSEKVRVLDLIRKEKKNYMLRSDICVKNESSVKL